MVPGHVANKVRTITELLKIGKCEQEIESEFSIEIGA
jgi:hypothetical protein